MIRHEKQCEGNLSTSLLEGSKGSDAALSDCENRTGADPKLNDVVLVGKGKIDMEVLGLSLFPFLKKGCRYVQLIRLHILSKHQ